MVDRFIVTVTVNSVIRHYQVPEATREIAIQDLIEQAGFSALDYYLVELKGVQVLPYSGAEAQFRKLKLSQGQRFEVRERRGMHVVRRLGVPFK